MILKLNFTQICTFQWTKLSFALEEFSFTNDFWVEQCKYQFSDVKNVLSVGFTKMKCKLLPACLANLKKHTKHLIFYDQNYGLIKLIFCISNIFKNLLHIKLFCVFYYMNMFDQTQYSLNIPFSNEICFKAGVQFQF